VGGRRRQPATPSADAPCHKAAREVSGYFDNVAFKVAVDPAGHRRPEEIVRFDPAALKVIDAGVAKTPEHMRDVRKGHGRG
jgi:hypothetical protein